MISFYVLYIGILHTIREAIYMVKKGFYLRIDEKILESFKNLCFQKHGKLYGTLGYELEQALLNWLALHTQNEHKQIVSIDKINPSPKIVAVWSQMKDYLKTKFGYPAVVPGIQIPRKHIIEAVMAVRGSDPRTVRKWFNDLQRFKLIKWIAGELYEVI